MAAADANADRGGDVALSDRLTVAKAIYGALPLTRPLVMPQAPGTSTGIAIPTPVAFIMPVPWDDLPTIDQGRYLAAAEAVEKAQLAGILADIDEADRAAERALAEYKTRQQDAREATAGAPGEAGGGVALRNTVRDLCTLVLGSAADSAQDQKDGLARTILDAIGRGYEPADALRSAAPAAGASFQARNAAWMEHTFDGVGDPTDLAERRDRFAEEALELIQATGGTLDGVVAQARYTFGRAKGQPVQEAGGTLATLAGLLTLVGIDMAQAADAELTAMWDPERVAKVRRKRANRHGRGVLPGDDADLVTPAPAAGAAGRTHRGQPWNDYQEAAARRIYEKWSDQSGYVPWVERGNSDMQFKARDLVFQVGQDLRAALAHREFDRAAARAAAERGEGA